LGQFRVGAEVSLHQALSGHVRQRFLFSNASHISPHFQFALVVYVDESLMGLSAGDVPKIGGLSISALNEHAAKFAPT